MPGSLQAYMVVLGVGLALSAMGWAGSSNATQDALSSPSCRFGLTETEFQSFTTSSPENLPQQLSALGVSKRQARHVLAMLQQRAALKDLREASRLVVARQLDPCDDGRAEVISLTLAVENAGDVTVARNDAGHFSLVGSEDLYVFHLRVNGRVQDGDLAASLIQAGLPGTVADQVIDSFSADGELPTYDIRSGAFDVVYQVFASAQGALNEAVLTAAELTVDQRSRRIYYYKPEGAEALVVDDRGRPVGAHPPALAAREDDLASLASDAALPQKFIHPLPQGRYTSGFGWRRHPVLGKRKFHNGVDFSAPQGTPVLAVGDGVVALVDKHRTYGKRIVLSHSQGVETVYAHLNGFAAAIRPGQIVRQGQIIGYVGRSGLASGNHLYLEIVLNGQFIDPMVNVPALKNNDRNNDLNYALAQAEEPAPSVVSDLDVKRFVAMADALRDHLPARSSVFR